VVGLKENPMSDDTMRVTDYLLKQIDGFISNPPDTDFQRGYLAAVLDTYEEGLGGPPDAVRANARRLCAS
jgi:hypothetical protein